MIKTSGDCLKVTDWAVVVSPYSCPMDNFPSVNAGWGIPSWIEPAPCHHPCS